MAITTVIVCMPINATSEDRLARFGCGVFLPFITAAERNKLLSVNGGGLTLDGLKALYPTHVEQIDGEAGNGTQNKAALANAPTVPVYYIGSFDVTAVEWGRIQGWLATATNLWIRLDLGAIEVLDEWGSAITGMPPAGTDLATIGGLWDLLRLTGIVEVQQ